MTAKPDLILQTLNREHDRQAFKCGVASLDSYIQKQARQNVKRNISRAFVATAVGYPQIIVGYYTLSSLSIELSQLPEALSRKLPRHPMRAALLGRLAVNLSAQVKGIGSVLLVDAIKRTLAVSEDIAIYSIVVDAFDEEAVWMIHPPRQPIETATYQSWRLSQLHSWATHEESGLFMVL